MKTKKLPTVCGSSRQVRRQDIFSNDEFLAWLELVFLVGLVAELRRAKKNLADGGADTCRTSDNLSLGNRGR